MRHQVQAVLNAFRDYVAQDNSEDRPVLTAYVNINPARPENQRAQPAWQIELKKAFAELREGLDQDALKRRDMQERWAANEDRLVTHLAQGKHTGRGVVVFTDHENDLVLDVPMELETRLAYGAPAMTDLLFLLDQYRQYLLVLFSGTEVRTIDVFLTRAADGLRADVDPDRRRDLGRKASTQARERRDLAHERRIVRDIAGEISDHFLSDPQYERIILGGNVKTAHAVQEALHPAAADRLVGIEPVPFAVQTAEAGEIVREIASRYEAEQDAATIARLVDSMHRGGPAVLGHEDTIRALQANRVRELVLPYPCCEDYAPLIELAIAQSATVEFVTGAAAARLEQVGGVGATVYFR
ncbi:hypothetical protein LCL97_11590 [Seohaeicola saemankumensis]|nr:hypothetical protein [Seohaeicola saemankumensis]MCA0871472.1 hypothetical protein [Seohaeicola saemankumensis]